MERYERYKDSAIEWIGEIPEHWRVIRVKQAYKIIMGQSPDSKSCNSLLDGVAFLQGNADFKTRNPIATCWCTDPRKIAPANGILISVRAPIGEVNIADQEYCIGRGLCALISENSLFSYYLIKCLSDELKSLGTGSTFKAVSVEQVANAKIIHPPLPEQLTIATYLDRKTAEIDDLIAKKKRLLELYEEEKIAIINHAVTKGINPDAPMKDSGIEWLGEIPEKWEVKRLKHIVKKLESGVSVNSVDKPIFGEEFGILKTSCVYDYSFRSIENKVIVSEKELKRAKVNPRKGSIIISRMNTPELVGASGYVEKDYLRLFLPDRLWQTVFFDNVLVNSRWLAFLMQSLSFRQNLSQLATGTSSSMKNIGQSDFLNTGIPFPAIREQDRIENIIVNSCLSIDKVILKIQNQIELLLEYRTALISEVVTGKVKVAE